MQPDSRSDASSQLADTSPSVIELQPHDDLASTRYHLDTVDGDRVILSLPWGLHFLSRALDFNLLQREAERRQLKIAIVSPDPQRQHLARSEGFPAFESVDMARSSGAWHSRSPEKPEPPPQCWWETDVDLRRRSTPSLPTWLDWLRQGLRVGAFVLALLVLVGSAYIIVPSAEVMIVPSGRRVTAVVPVSVDPDLEKIEPIDDGMGGVIPSRRVGVEVSGYAEVETSGTRSVAAGRATGEVMFTNLLMQDYVVPAGTVVRTSSTSYPIRFRTTADVAVPAGGQAAAPIEALEQGVGNVAALRINRVEGSASSAVRVINPQPTTGAEPKDVSAVVQEDYDRVRDLLTQQLLDKANAELGELLKATEFLPRQSLRVEAVPKKSYTHFIGEQTEKVGLDMRLLVSGQAVDVANAESVAYRALSQKLPAGYRLVDARFELGEVAEENVGPGLFTFFVTGRGYAAASLNAERVVDMIRGRRLSQAKQVMEDSLPLGEDPRFTVWPEWLGRLPLLSLRINVNVLPKGRAVSQATTVVD